MYIVMLCKLSSMTNIAHEMQIIMSDSIPIQSANMVTTWTKGMTYLRIEEQPIFFMDEHFEQV